MYGWTAYSLGFDAGHSNAENSRRDREIVDRVFYGARPVKVDQSYIDQLRNGSNLNYQIGFQAQRDAAWWKAKAEQFRTEALWWRDENFDPLAAEAERLRQENAALRNRLEERNPDLAAEQDAHQKTHEEKQSLHCFRLVATAILDALLAGRADRPEFAELVAMVKEGADVIDRGGLYFGFSETPEKAERLDALTDALARP
jgi:hypothetical protein